MWERWGSPTFEPTLDGQLRQAVTGAVAGIEHGWRYIAQRADQGLSWSSNLTWWVVNAPRVGAAQHDQLCLPGPPRTTLFTHPLAWLGPGDDLTVKYNFLDPVTPATTTPQPAGGDLYLLPCNALTPNDPTWAVGGYSNAVPTLGTTGIGGPATKGAAPNLLVPQYKRMLTCVAYAFSEVYKAGPGPDLTYRPAQPVETGPFDDSLKDYRAAGFASTFPDDVVAVNADTEGLLHRCFGQRATNHSMVLGSGISDWGDFDSYGPRSQLTVALLPGQAANATQLATWAGKPTPGSRFDGTPFDKVKADFARDLGAFSLLMAQNERRDRDGTTSARGILTVGNSQTFTFLDQRSNQLGARDILDGKVPYLERRDPSTWTTAPAEGQTTDCTDDTYCPAHFPGTFCDRTNGYKSLPAPGTGKYGEVGPVVGRCVPLETAVLRAFHAAETPYWCANDTVGDLDAARGTCKHAIATRDNGGANPALGAAREYVPECEACAEKLLPHMRASCNSKGYKIANDPRRRSVCDVLKDGGVGTLRATSLEATTLYVPYDPASFDEALQAARYVCAVSTELPTDTAPTSASTQGISFFRASGGTACFNTCDSCTTCLETGTGPFGGVMFGAAGGPLEVHSSESPTSLSYSYYPRSGKALLFGAQSDVIDIALGVNATCAVRADQTVWCAGDNTNGQLGIGDLGVTASVVPRKVESLSGTGIGHVYTAGPNTMCATTPTGGSAWCWGQNENGEVGDGTNTDRAAPVPIAIPGPAQEILPAPAGTACARTFVGTVACWGGLAPDQNSVRLPTVVPEVNASLLGGGRIYLSGSTVMEWRSDAGRSPGDPTCPNTVPIDVGGFVPKEIGYDGNGFWCLRSDAGDVACFTQESIKPPPSPSPSPVPDNCPAQLTATLTPTPFKATALAVTGVGFTGYGPLAFARSGDSLYLTGEELLNAPLAIPALKATEGAAKCGP
jgi:hypothetical protein